MNLLLCPQFRELGLRARNRRGFTFIEILVVVLVLGIASAIIVPQISAHDDLDAAAAARAVMADLLYAQNRAISTGQTMYVSFNPSGQQYGLYSSMTPQQQVLTHPVNLNNYVMTFGQAGSNNISADVTLGSVSFNSQNTIAFDELGIPYAYNSGITPLTQPGTIVLNCGSYSLTISVTQDTGEITVN